MLATGLAACGTVKELGAADKVSTAFGKLGDGKSLKVEVSVDATAAQLLAFSRAVDPGKPMDQKSAEAVTGLSLSYSMSADKPLKELDTFKKAKGSGDYNALYSDPAVNFSYALAGKDGKVYADVRKVGDRAYEKFDIEGFLALVGQDPAAIRKLADRLPADDKAAREALAGHWISFDAKAMEQLGKSSGKAAPTTAPTLDASTARDFGKSVRDILSKRLSFEDKGGKDGADHIVASAPARGLAEDLLKAVGPLSAKTPGLAGLPVGKPSLLPDRRLDLDLYVKDGALSSATFDVAQLSEKAGRDVHLPVKVAFGQDATAAQAPSGATEFTAADIRGAMTAVLMAAVSGADDDQPGPATGEEPAPGTSAAPVAPGDAGAGAGSGEGEGEGEGDGSKGSTSKLTDDQVKELAKAGGVSEETIRLMARSGDLTYQDFKDMFES
ncbi:MULTISPECIES: hypothetical protein [Kitasatospora]|uniref:hypothetical protein n=1 Tax=Kitasatospora TaxID=2063 RepID=UPI0031CDC5C9